MKGLFGRLEGKCLVSLEPTESMLKRLEINVLFNYSYFWVGNFGSALSCSFGGVVLYNIAV